MSWSTRPHRFCPLCQRMFLAAPDWDEGVPEKFCGACGFALVPLVCGACGNALRVSPRLFGGSIQRFCGACGHDSGTRHPIEPQMCHKPSRLRKASRSSQKSSGG